MKALLDLLKYVLENFGPLVVFLIAEQLLTLRGAIVFSVLYSVVEWVIRKRTGRGLTGFFKFSVLLTCTFGVIDVFLKDSILFRYEAVITNIVTGVYFAKSCWAPKPLLQEFAERKRKFEEHDARDVRFFFQFFTWLWVFYFIAKAVCYFILASTTLSYLQLTLIRAAIGKITLIAMITASTTGGRQLWRSLLALKWMPSARVSGISGS